MDAVEFLDKVDRLSKRGSTEEKMRYNDYRAAKDNAGVVKFVERWDAEHPAKTRQSVFLERYPEAQTDIDDVLCVCPAVMSLSYRDDVGGCLDVSKRCDNCRRKFWSAEVEE